MRSRAGRSWSCATLSRGQVTLEFSLLFLVMLLVGFYFANSVLETFLRTGDISALVEAHRIASYVASAVAGTISWLPDWQATANQIYLPERIGDSEYYLKLRAKELASVSGLTMGEIEVVLQLGGRWERKVEVVVDVPVLLGSLSPWRPGVVMIDPNAYRQWGSIIQVNEWPPGSEWWCSTSGQPFSFGFYVIPAG